MSKSKSKNEDVNQDEVTKFHDNQFKKYEDNLELDEDTRNRFLESYCQETVDSPEKADRLITFMRQDLKFQDRFYDNSSISIIIFCLKFREDSTVTTEDLFKILKLNQEKNLSLSVLLDCVKKFDIDCDNIETLLSFAKKYEFYAKETENKQEKHNNYLYMQNMNFFAARALQQEVNMEKENKKWANYLRNQKINYFFDLLCLMYLQILKFPTKMVTLHILKSLKKFLSTSMKECLRLNSCSAKLINIKTDLNF